MANTYTQLLAHLVFSTKHREPLITSELHAPLMEYIGGIITGQKATPLAINGVADHIHILLRMPTDISIADMLRVIKSNSSKWINEGKLCPQEFAWQTGYSAFSVSKSLKDTVESYILNQQEHHRRMSFKEELIALLERHGIEYDPQYVFD